MYKTNKYFYFPFLLCFLIGLPLLFFYPKGWLVTTVNHWHTPFWDFFFYYTTRLGNGVIFAVIILALLFYRFRYALIGGASFVFSGVFSQMIKHALNFPRPKAALDHFSDLNIVEGVAMHAAYSFPSGHATTIFALCSFLALIARPKQVGLLLLFVAITVAFSRVYLVLHFFVDIYFGALIGVTFTTFIYWYGTYHYKVNQLKWIDQSLYSLWKN